jgi:hypothetical protein
MQSSFTSDSLFFRIMVQDCWIIHVVLQPLVKSESEYFNYKEKNQRIHFFLAKKTEWKIQHSVQDVHSSTGGCVSQNMHLKNTLQFCLRHLVY